MVGVDEAERGEPFLGRLGAQRTGPGEGVEDRREEQPLMDPANDTLPPPLVSLERIEGAHCWLIAVAEHPSQQPPTGGFGGQGVGLLLVAELQAVLDRAQEDVGVAQLPGVVGFDIAAAGELRQGFERRRRPDARVLTPVDELQQLYGELDVADPAAPAFQLPVAQSSPLNLGFGAGLHGSHLAHGVGIEHVGPYERPGERQEPFRQRRVAGHRPGLDERLELPRAGPPLVPRGVPVDGPGQRAGASLGAQIGVGAEHRPVSGGLRHDRQDPTGAPFGVVSVAVVDEQDVDVAGVVELASAELAHPDHGEGQRLAAELERGAEADVGEVREATTDGREVREPQEIGGGDPEQLAPLPASQRRRIRGVQVRHGLVEVTEHVDERGVLDQRVRQ